MTDAPSTLLLGLGNPLLRDDAAGLELAARVHALLPRLTALRQEHCPGLELVDALGGYERVVILDALCTPECRAGALYRVHLDSSPADAPRAAHAFGLLETLELMRRLALPVPGRVAIFAIGVQDPFTFATELSPEVAAAMPAQALRLARVLGRWIGASPGAVAPGDVRASGAECVQAPAGGLTDR